VRILLQSKNLLTIGWDAFSSSESGGLPIINYMIRTDDSDFVLKTPIANGNRTIFSKIIMQPGNEGKVYRFRVAAENVLGVGTYSNEIQLMATDVPAAPTLSADQDSRTLNTIQL
jgi:hypothetical protein